jgi:uncharacterized protein (TIGR02270 family)
MARYQGNPPRAASGIVVSDVVELHAGDAAFLWLLRSKAVTSQKYRLRDLARADERVEAHLDGLEVSGSEGWAKLIDDMGDGQAGAIFAGAVWAMRTGDAGRFGAAVDSAQDKRACLDALVSAFGWAWSGGTADDRPDLAPRLVGPPRSAVDAAGPPPAFLSPPETWARLLLAESSAASRFVAVGAFAVCRVSPTDDELDLMLLKESHAPAMARAARLVGEIGIVSAARTLEYLLVHEVPEVRAAAAWSLCVLQAKHEAAIQVLMAATQNAEIRPDVLADVVAMAARRMAAEDLHGWVRELARAGHSRMALIAAAAAGFTALIDDILALMADEESARLAGFAFTQITGADLVKLDLERDDQKDKTPESEATPADAAAEDDEAPSPEEEEDSHLPDPDPALVAGWWRDHRSDFSPAVRYLAGRPILEAGLHQTLIDGTQPQRRAAAIELACLTRWRPVYNTSQPGFAQARGLLGWT